MEGAGRWMAVFEVFPASPECEYLAKNRGAFVHVLGIASCEEEFLNGAAAFCEGARLLVQGITDVEAIDARLAAGDMDPLLEEAASALGEDMPYHFGVFHIFPRRVFGHSIWRAMSRKRRGGA